MAHTEQEHDQAVAAWMPRLAELLPPSGEGDRPMPTHTCSNCGIYVDADGEEAAYRCDRGNHKPVRIAIGGETVPCVEVDGRFDGLYIFRDPDDAARFAKSVERQGGSAAVGETPLNDSAMTDLLVDAEREA